MKTRLIDKIANPAWVPAIGRGQLVVTVMIIKSISNVTKRQQYQVLQFGSNLQLICELQSLYYKAVTIKTRIT